MEELKIVKNDIIKAAITLKLKKQVLFFKTKHQIILGMIIEFQYCKINKPKQQNFNYSTNTT